MRKQKIGGWDVRGETATSCKRIRVIDYKLEGEKGAQGRLERGRQGGEEGWGRASEHSGSWAATRGLQRLPREMRVTRVV